MGDDQVRSWLHSLRVGDSQQRTRAVEALIELGQGAVGSEKGAAGSLRSALRDGDPRARIAAAQVMGRLEIDDDQALDVVVELIDSEAPGVRGEALCALLYFASPPPTLVPQLIAGLEGDSGEVYVCKLGLTAVGGPAVPELCRAIEHRDPAVRRRVVAVLGAIRERYAAAVAPGERPRRWWTMASPAYAARARDHLGPAIQALLAALRDDDASVRRRAATAVACGAVDRIPVDLRDAYLGALLDTDNATACFALADALASLEPANRIMASRRWRALGLERQARTVQDARYFLGADGAERAIRAIFLPDERVDELLRRPGDEDASDDQTAETTRLIEAMVREGRFRI